jgi:hypothetical protein
MNPQVPVKGTYSDFDFDFDFDAGCGDRSRAGVIRRGPGPVDPFDGSVHNSGI